MSPSILAPRPARKWLLFAALIVFFLTSIASAYSAPRQQADSPTLAENLPYLTLDHYEMDPRAYRESSTPAAPAAPSSPSYLPWSRLVYQSYRTNNWDIYLSDADGTFETRLTTSSNDDIHPRLNRGGTRLAYASKQNGAYEIFVMNSDGTNKIRLTNNNTDDVNPFWSPDGSKIVFQAYRDGQPEIYVMNADGSGQTRLTNSSDYDGMPAWSPNGATIAFTSRRTGGYRVYTMNPDGSNQIQRSNQPYSLEPSWSPASTQIGYSGDGDNNGWFEVWLMNADGTSPVLKQNPGYGYDSLVRSWSPDGQYIAFAEIRYILYQGSWYWTETRLQAVGAVSGFITIGPNAFPYRDWYPDWQTLDIQQPTSRVTALPSVSPAVFTVNWSGSDEGGAGIMNYDVQIRDGANGSWTTWKTATTQTAAAYTGIGGHTYYFRSRARDNGHNLEPWPSTHDALTTVEASPPHVFMVALPAYSRREGFVLQWQGTDPGGSGIANYDVQYRAATGGSWTNLVTNTTATTAPFNGTAGTTYYFQVRGRDKAQNVSTWPNNSGHTVTTLYTWTIGGNATNTAGVPIMGLTTTTTPGAFATLPVNAQGRYGAYVAPVAGAYTVDWSKGGYGDLPATQFNGNSDALLNMTMPPIDNVTQNGHFESGGFNGWQTSGTLPITQTQNSYHTGANAALFGEPAPFTAPTPFSSSSHQPLLRTDANGVIHATWVTYNNAFRVYYSQRTNYGTWSAPLALSPANQSAYDFEMTVMDDGQIHAFWLSSDATVTSSLYYVRRNSNGSWATPVKISGNHNVSNMGTFIDASGRGHALYERSDDATIYYVRQNTNGTWANSETVVQNVSHTIFTSLVTDTLGYVHAFWLVSNNNALYYARRDTNGSWTTPVMVSTAGSISVASDILVDENGGVHLLWGEYLGGQTTLYYQKIKGASLFQREIVSTVADEGAMVVDEEGNASVVWAVFYDVYYKERIAGVWSEPQRVHTFVNLYPADFWLTRSANGTLYLALYAANFSDQAVLYFSQRPYQGNWAPITQIVSLFGIFSEPDLSLTADPSDTPHLMWFDQTEVYYSSLSLATQAGNGTLQQTVTIPITHSVPTLSFWYWLDGTTGTGGSTFTVSVDEGSSGNILLNAQTDTSGWRRASFDMTAYAGQTITLTFGLEQVAHKPMSSVYLDEVTLGSTHPDVWVEGEYQTALPGEEVTYAITYGNRGAAAATAVTLNHTLTPGLTFISATVPPSQINGSALTWNLNNLDSNTGPVTIYVTVRINAAATPFTVLSSSLNINTTSGELETINNQATIQIYLAQMTYVPVITR